LKRNHAVIQAMLSVAQDEDVATGENSHVGNAGEQVTELLIRVRNQPGSLEQEQLVARRWLRTIFLHLDHIVWRRADD
jgi:hypothetical protein